ncbi:MAG: Glu/Leu/Phe/Val dehydrogenase [Chlamydiales bacterium]|nr:Glu/Leu/Phe/Val dehydrogenase [Chlamydiales bacterium]
MALLLEEIIIPDYEKVVKVTDESVGLKAIIAIHNTNMGPALGGLRIYPYTTFDDALTDVLRLSKGMTYKSAVSQTGLGGGKSVIMIDKQGKNPALLRAFGKAVDMLQGAYICAEDVGCTVEDIKVVRETTRYVTGLASEKSSGDPAPFTAWGTYRGIQSITQFLFGTDSVAGKTIAIQGLGAVGGALLDILFWEGADLIVTDIDEEKAKRLAKQYAATYVPPDQILFVKCDILAPCALGGIINQHTISKLRCRAIGGAANNQLLEDVDANRLLSYGILYAPDFVINAGGIINVRNELVPSGYNARAARNEVHKIYDRLLDIYHIAKQNRCSTHHAAVMLAEHRIRYHIGKEEQQLCFHH